MRIPLGLTSMLRWTGTLLVTLGAASACSKSAGPPLVTSCDDIGEVGDSPSCPGLCAITNGDFCAGVQADIDCASASPGAVDVCGVTLAAPISGGEVFELSRSSNVLEFAGTGKPDLSCMLESGFPDPPNPMSQMATMRGVVKIFSHGCSSNNVSVEVHTVKRTGGPDDGEPNQLVGSTFITASDCFMNGVPEENDDCLEYSGQRWECAYEYPGVPTDTELMVITKGSGWSHLYEYNVYVPQNEVVQGFYDKDVRALAADDYTTIPQTVKGEQMRPGHGAIGGEVHDCGDVRLIGAVVDVDQKRTITYFGDDEVTPLPKPGALYTSSLGLYALLDVPPGPVNVAAAGVVDGKLVGVGFFKARVFPDAVTSITFRGLRPFQLPQ
jgi:hypothetical protein